MTVLWLSKFKVDGFGERVGDRHTWVSDRGLIPMTFQCGFSQKLEHENANVEKFHVFHSESRLSQVTCFEAFLGEWFS